MQSFPYPDLPAGRFSVRPVDGGCAVTLFRGSTGRDLAAAAAAVPEDAVLVPGTAWVDRGDVTVLFEHGPGAGHPVVARPTGPLPAMAAAAPPLAGWTPDTAAVGPAPTLTRFQLAVGELLGTARGATEVGQILGMLGNEPPSLLETLAGLSRQARASAARCCATGEHDCAHCATTLVPTAA